jgi:protein involved in ribonucleotide reduction
MGYFFRQMNQAHRFVQKVVIRAAHVPVQRSAISVNKPPSELAPHSRIRATHTHCICTREVRSLLREQSGRPGWRARWRLLRDAEAMDKPEGHM